MSGGLALALSWLTVLPVRAGAPDARTAAAALRWAPLVGGLVGAATGALAVGLAAVGVPPAVAGLLAVGFAGLATRGMHLDGLADTADGLGCYGPPERALAVMRDGGAGPFAVVTLVVVVGVQAAALATLAGPGPFAGGAASTAVAGAAGAGGAGQIVSAAGAGGAGGLVSAAGAGGAGQIVSAAGAGGAGELVSAAGAGGAGQIVSAAGAGGAGELVSAAGAGGASGLVGAVAVVGAVALAGAAGRAAFLWVARRGVPAARPNGLGATVAGSQPWWAALVWWAALAGAGYALTGPRGVLAVGLGGVVVVALSWHTGRRFGGMTGDILGAASELATTAALVVLAAR